MKKVISLMMLLLAFTGFVRAGEITVHDGNVTSSYIPVWGLWTDNSLQHEFVYPANELGAMNGEEISKLKFYTNVTSSGTFANISWNGSFRVYLKEVASASIASFLGTDDATLVYEGLLGVVSNEMEITFATPYTYNGGNLWIGVYYTATTGYSSSQWVGETVSGAAVYGRSGANYTVNTTDFLPKTTFTHTGSGNGGGGFEDMLHVKYMDGDTEVVDTLNMGVRPVGAWMEPFQFTMYSDGPTYTVTVLDFTPSDGMFSVSGQELPFQVAPNADVDLTMAINGTQPGIIERQFVAITEGNRAAHIWPVTVELYSPECPDVVEVAYDFGVVEPGFSYVGVPADITPTTLHDDYTLPFPEIPEGVDAVYKLTFEQDQLLNAYVSEGENGKVALYTEDFYGEGGPMAHNYYQGPGIGGGGLPFEAMIGDENSTTVSSYFPFHVFFRYSIGENLFLASELTEAGVTTAPMTSLSWYVDNTTCNQVQNGISIWMANVEETEITTMSHITSGMTLVYTGNNLPAPVVGWNEFVLNGDSFAWDGVSNVLIVCQRNNGEYQGRVNWKTHNPGFYAMGYKWTDGSAYDMTTESYSLTRSNTNRANIIMKGGGRSNRDLTVGFESGLPAGWTTIDADGDGHNWIDIDNFTNEYSYYTGMTLDWYHGGSNAMLSASYINQVGALTPDNYLVSPQVTLGAGSSINFWMAAADESYPTEHFGVFVSDNGTSNWTMVQEWTMTAKSGGRKTDARATRGGEGLRIGNWYNYTVDLSAYTGQKYVAIRHFNSYDQYILCLDDITIVEANTTPGPTPTSGGAISAGPVIENLPVTPGTYYLVASSTDPGFEVTINAEQIPCPAVEEFAFGPTPPDDYDEAEPASVTLHWNIPPYATGWRLIFGSTYYPEPGHPQTIMYPEDGSFSTDLANSFTVRNLWNNTNYFWHVEFNNDGCPEGVSSPIWGFTTHLNIPNNLHAEDETIFEGEDAVLLWNPVVDRTYRMYNVYQDGQLIGHTTVNDISNATYTVSGLTYNMTGYTFQVSAVYDEGESALSDPCTVKVSGYGDVNGHVYEQDGTTGIAGATVTMVGQDEFGVSHTYTFQTNAQGYYSGSVYAGNYNGSASMEGYQTITEPVQGNPIEIIYNETTSPIDYMLDENFNPVCQVIAEYYPDSLDPESPYVKVYWGCGLPGSEIIEDFETGDFSLFDWQLDPTYPWTITTNNPYEGTYCMKSGGAGVANVVSNMTVTVNIPYDGIMSFFGKISSENNWDYGYFFIDGVQKGSYTGAGTWTERKFDITAGDHTFQWRYTKDGSVNSNDDCFYVDYITFYKQPEPVGPGWHTYLESEFDNAYRSTVGDPSWGYEYPTTLLSQYAGYNLTKVAVFSDDMYGAVGGNFTCNVYVGGTTPAAGTLASTITVDVPVGQGAWCEYDLTTPVNVTGTEPIWVLWTVNTYGGLGYPAGCASHSSQYGDWWNNGQDGWEHMGDCTWTMKNYFTNRSGRTVVLADAETALKAVGQNNLCSNLRAFVKGQEDKTAECVNPNAVAGDRINTANRSLNHYRVYRTNCYQECPFTEENTVLLATVWVPDTVYIDVEWADLEPGVYKWGVGAVYEGNRGEMIEAPINWAAPQAVTRDNSADATTAAPVEFEGSRTLWDELGTVTCSSAYQYGVASDGQNIYTSAWSSNAGFQFAKYGMDGSFVETFNVPGSGYCRDLTYDGQYFYGVACTSTVYCLDLANQTLVNTFTSSYGAMRGIGYDSQSDGFWVVGNWSGTLSRIDRNGVVQFTGPTPSSVSGLAYYRDSSNEEHVLLNCQPSSNAQIDDYNITTNTLTSNVHTITTADISGGMHIGAYNGITACFASLQSNPNVIHIYDLDVSAGPSPTPGPGGTNCNALALPRESETIWSNCLDKDMFIIGENQDGVTVNVLLNSADSPEGVQVTFTNYNEAEQEMYPVAPIELDETGFYAFESFRKGEYNVKVEFDGYEPIEDSVSIWAPTDLRYVMTEIIYGVSDLYVSSTGWAMWGAEGTPVAPTPPGTGSTFSVDFESGMPDGWTTIDADGDGYNWVLGSAVGGIYLIPGASLAGAGHNASGDLICSGSYENNYYQALHPDNFLVSPQVTLATGSAFSFWACAQDAGYPAEHFGVFVSDNGTSDWTEVQSWTMTAKSGGNVMSIGRGGETRAQGNWYNYSVDLSAYAGQKYIAIRHFNCTDQFILDVDDIELSSGAKDGDRHLEYFKVMCTSIDGEPI
ncbi:MAG: choice-of-anchor J domain-containing protein, partial [bacterium]|nr:choice-of-anchor J domain-containing protein [bacterium]